MMIPKLQLILEYKHFFDTEPPENRLELIKHIPKKELLYEIAGLNYRLKPYNTLKYDTSLDTQVYELKYFCPIDEELHKNYVSIASKHTKSKDEYPLIFNRAANLFALEEILNYSDFVINEDFQMKRTEVWDSIFRYLLAVNSEITKVKHLKSQDISIENISASSIVLNELMIEDNPFFMPYRGVKLIEYISNHPTYGVELERYFVDVLGVEKNRFIYNLLALSMANGQKEQFAEFVYNTDERDNFLEYLSENRIENQDPIKLLSIKKTPFYKETDSRYLVLDINFLVNKSYSFFINDFWFDYLKPQQNDQGRAKFNFKDYRGVFGLFFETYIKGIIENSFTFLKHPKPLLFDDLKIATEEGEIEVADIYIRHNKKVLVGQVKSSSIYDNEKFGGDINTLYRHNREQFFIDFGVNQTLNSIKVILKNFDLFDSKLQVDKKLEFYPIVVVNEKLFQTPLLSNLLHMRFQELLKDEDFGIHQVHQLVVVHVSDLEYLETRLTNKKTTIWDLLKSHYKKVEKSIMPPFAASVNKLIDPKAINGRVMDTMGAIIKQYSDEDN